MKIVKIACYTLVPLLLTACFGSGLTQFSQQKITSPRIVTISGPDAPWINNIRLALIKKGFKVLHWPSQQKVYLQTSPSKMIKYNEASTRFVLMVSGYAPLDAMHRCIGGGYVFDYISAELVDVKRNETIFSYDNRGHSENCQPLSGHIFNDIADAVASNW